MGVGKQRYSLSSDELQRHGVIGSHKAPRLHISGSGTLLTRARQKQADEARAVASYFFLTLVGTFLGEKRKRKEKSPVLVCNGLNLNKQNFSGGRLLPLQGVKVGLILHSLGGMLGTGGRCRGGPSFSGKVKDRVLVAPLWFSSCSG